MQQLIKQIEHFLRRPALPVSVKLTLKAALVALRSAASIEKPAALPANNFFTDRQKIINGRDDAKGNPYLE